MIRKIQVLMAAVLYLVFLADGSSHACTYFYLKAKDGSVISGRTDEFYDETGSKIDLVPRGMAFKSTAPEGGKALSWKTRYGFVGISAFGMDVFMEGMNEKGLAAGGLYFEDVEFPAAKKGDEVVNVVDVIGWVLGNFQTAAEVEEALKKVKVWSNADNPLKMPVLPFHFYVTDAAGGSIVVECIEGNLKIWDNRANGVMTNEPNLGWHLTNLRFYSNMNPNSVPLPQLNDEKWSLGTGLMGLPGDYTCAGRFVRTSVLKYFSEQPKDAAGGVTLALHLINAVDIPYGPQVWIQGQKCLTQWTIWSVVHDQTSRCFYFRTYDNQNVRRIDLKKLDLSEGSGHRRIEMFGGASFIDDTGRLTAPAKK